MTRHAKMCATLTALFLGACSAEPEPLERSGDGCEQATAEERFSCRVGDRLEDTFPGADAVPTGRLELAIVVEEATVHARLDNLYDSCRAAPGGCEDAVATFARTARETVERGLAPVDPGSVRATLKPRAYLTAIADEVRAVGGDEDEVALQVPLSRPFLGDLIAVYVEDRPDSMALLTRDRAAPLGLSEDALHRLALRNLEEAVTPFAHEALEPGSRIRVIEAGDSYESARLLLVDAWRPVAAEVEGDLVVAAPSRDIVLFTGDAHLEDVARLRELAREGAAEMPYPLSPTLMRLEPEGWRAIEDEE